MKAYAALTISIPHWKKPRKRSWRLPDVPVGVHRSMNDWLTEVVGSRKHAQVLLDRMMPRAL